MLNNQRLASDRTTDRLDDDIIYVKSPYDNTLSLGLQLENASDFTDPKGYLEPPAPAPVVDYLLDHAPAFDSFPPFSPEDARAHAEQVAGVDALIYHRRKRVLMFLLVLDLFYSVLLIFMSVDLSPTEGGDHHSDSHDSYSDTQIAKMSATLRAVWILGFVSDIIGLVGAYRNPKMLLSAFVVLLGCSVVLFSLVVFSPLLILRLIIFLFGVQLRMGMPDSIAAAQFPAFASV